MVAALATLIEHFSVVPVLGVSPYQYSHLLARPDIRKTGTVLASELAHDVGRVFFVGFFVVTILAKPCGVDTLGDCFDDVLVEQRKHERRPRLSTGFGGLLLHHLEDFSDRART